MSAQQIAALKQRAKLCTPTKTKGSSEVLNLCICNRQLQDILCRSCGYLFVGRQRKQCVYHPNEIHLMDSAVCPKCRTDALIEIKTSDTPVKKQPDEIMTELSHLRQRRISGGVKSDASLKGISTGVGIWEDRQTTNPPKTYSATVESPLQLRNTTTDESWDNELSSLNVFKPSPVPAGMSLPPKSTSASNSVPVPKLWKPSSVTFATSPMANLSSKPALSQLSKVSSASCTEEELMKEVGNPEELKASSSVRSVSTKIQLKHNETEEQESGKEMHKDGLVLPVAEHKAKLTLTTFHGNGQSYEPGGLTKPDAKMVDSEVQTEFVVQVMEEPKFLNQVMTNVQPKVIPSKGYVYQPKRPIDGGKETSILKAAIKRSIAQGWHREMDKMSDLYIGDR